MIMFISNFRYAWYTFDISIPAVNHSYKEDSDTALCLHFYLKWCHIFWDTLYNVIVLFRGLRA